MRKKERDKFLRVCGDKMSIKWNGTWMYEIKKGLEKYGNIFP